MFEPTKIVINNEEEYFQIIWSDGKIYHYPLFGLRRNCPCVMCRGGHDKMQIFEPSAFNETASVPVTIHRAEQIGNHAIQIHWSDGHNSGMYRWSTLRYLYEEWKNEAK
tara:strand:+ start:2699 stop:3025 length:327 start_codon:yes stop_codon:yes gene_type:complete